MVGAFDGEVSGRESGLKLRIVILWLCVGQEECNKFDLARILFSFCGRFVGCPASFSGQFWLFGRVLQGDCLKLLGILGNIRI